MAAVSCCIPGRRRWTSSHGPFSHSYLQLNPQRRRSKSKRDAAASHSCAAAAAIRARCFPVISLGSGVAPGHGTWPSTSQMHSRRQYFRGPKLAGLEACILACASACNTSLSTGSGEKSAHSAGESEGTDCDHPDYINVYF